MNIYLELQKLYTYELTYPNYTLKTLDQYGISGNLTGKY